MLNHDLLFSVPCCFLLDRLIKEATCNVMVDHLQSRVMPWRQYASHLKVRGTLSKMDVPLRKYVKQYVKQYVKLKNIDFSRNVAHGFHFFLDRQKDHNLHHYHINLPVKRAFSVQSKKVSFRKAMEGPYHIKASPQNQNDLIHHY